LSNSAAFGIVTPEAVVLDLPPAGVATRLFAKSIDLSGQAGLIYLSALAFGGIAGLGSGASTAALVAFGVWVFFVLLVLPGLVEARWNGRTPGKAVMGLRAVTLDGGPTHLRHSMIRGLFQLVDVYMTLGLVPAMITPRSQRFGDFAAGTFVLSERNATAPMHPVAFFPPPGWDGYVYSLDVSHITERQYRLLRSFLLRVSDLDGWARQHLAVRLADRVVPRVRPQPQGISAEQFVHCVVSAYQYRNGGFPPPSAIRVPLVSS
jgi:uncharacterized RDD family membrane protein YckC